MALGNVNKTAGIFLPGIKPSVVAYKQIKNTSRVITDCIVFVGISFPYMEYYILRMHVSCLLMMHAMIIVNKLPDMQNYLIII